MTAEQYVACLRSDDDYKEFILTSTWLYVAGSISETELKKRMAAISSQIKKQ